MINRHNAVIIEAEFAGFRQQHLDAAQDKAKRGYKWQSTT